MRKTFKLNLMLPAILFLGGCTSKLRYPIEEIKRPISLPAKNWGLSLGLGPGYYHRIDTSYYYKVIAGNIPYGYAYPVVGYPFLPVFNDKAELHFTLLNIKFYPFKQVKIEDSTVCIDGFNWAVGGGIAGAEIFLYDNKPFQTTSMPLNLFSEIKAPVTLNKWVFSKLDFTYNPNPAINYYHRIDLSLNFGIGMQFNRNLYSTVALSGYYGKRTYKLETPLNHTKNNIVEEYQVFFPFQIGYNITNRWKIFLFGNTGFYIDGDYRGDGGIGFDFYW